ncbi:MAG: CoA transferase [Lachnospiraceae bacterium]|nr:CoA transferase [Lachnospiraceae bacterium]
MACKGPLSGYRILDMTQFESGTVCTETLAWFGAEVLKVERPVKGELGRYTQAEPGIDSYGFLVMNMNKKSITCNAKAPEGLALLKKLVAKCDVIVENMGPGSMDRLGLTYEACKEINPLIIYASLKGFAQDGPYRDYPAFDPIATHTGVLVSVTGLPDQPIKAGISVADSGTGTALAMSIIAALLQREREGVGQRVDIAMQDFMIGLSRSQWEPYYANGRPNRRVGNGMPLEDVAPSNTYPCKPFGPNDYVHIYCSRHPGSRQWDELCDVIGRPDLKQDVCPEMATPHERYLHREICDAAITEWLKDYDKITAMDILAKADIPAGAILDCDDITNDPQYLERGMMVEIDHPQRGKVKLPGFAPRLSENHIEYEPSPALGESNDEIYGGLLGLSAEELAELKEKKVI